MKCHACGYEKKSEPRIVETPVLYRAGPKKGQVKRIDTATVDPYADDPAFIRILVERDFEFRYRKSLGEAHPWGDRCGDINVWGCPRCGTLRIDSWLVGA
jgi:DNA-directed RNA polymerase subunit M/transcription elongation factor TFIIS